MNFIVVYLTLIEMKQKLLTLLLSSISVLFYQNVIGQCCPYIDTLIVSPTNPNAGDQIIIYAHVTTPNLGGKISRSHYISNDTIFLTACYYSGMLTALGNYVDTFNIGTLNGGAYQVEFTAYQVGDLEECGNATVFQKNSFELNVGGTNSIGEIGDQQVSIFPNPATNVLWVEVEHLKKINVFGLNGQIHHLKYSLSKDGALIDTDQLSPGFYVLETILEGELVSRTKFVKR